MNFLDKLIEIEGGYNDIAEDSGGKTKYGISQQAYPTEDIENLTIERAKELYTRDYLIPSKCDKLPENLQYLHFDATVNHGPKNAAKILQRAAGVYADGIIGSATLGAAQKVTPFKLIAYRSIFYLKVVGKKDKEGEFKGSYRNAIFAKGWANRLLELIEINEKFIS